MPYLCLGPSPFNNASQCEHGMLFSHYWEERNKTVDKLERAEYDAKIAILEEYLEVALSTITEVSDERNNLRDQLKETLQEIVDWANLLNGGVSTLNATKLEETIAALEEY